jgi:hypothetical protein
MRAVFEKSDTKMGWLEEKQGMLSETLRRHEITVEEKDLYSQFLDFLQEHCSPGKARSVHSTYLYGRYFRKMIELLAELVNNLELVKKTHQERLESVESHTLHVLYLFEQEVMLEYAREENRKKQEYLLMIQSSLESESDSEDEKVPEGEVYIPFSSENHVVQGHMEPLVGGMPQRGNGRRKGKARRQGRGGARGGNPRFPLQPKMTPYGQTFAAPSETHKFKYIVLKTVAGAFSSGNVRFRVNDGYQMDAAVGPPSPPIGITAWSNIYALYRGIKTRVTLEICNLDVMPIIIYTQFSNTDPGVGATLVDLGNPLTKKRILSPKGGQDRATLTQTATMSRILGSNSPEYEDNYRALIGSASPADLLWWSFGAASTSGANITLGVQGLVTIETTFMLYDLKSQVT